MILRTSVTSVALSIAPLSFSKARCLAYDFKYMYKNVIFAQVLKVLVPEQQI